MCIIISGMQCSIFGKNDVIKRQYTDDAKMKTQIQNIIARDGLCLEIQAPPSWFQLQPNRPIIVTATLPNQINEHFLDIDPKTNRVHGMFLTCYHGSQVDECIRVFIEFCKLIACLDVSFEYSWLYHPRLADNLRFAYKAYLNRRDRATRHAWNKWIERACRPVDGKLYKLYERQWNSHLLTMDASGAH